MKKIILLFALLIGTIGFAQSSGFNYKALVVDNGTPVANRLISVKIELKNGTSTKWLEQHDNVQTDANGIFSLSIGNGTRIGGAYGNFADINWGLYSDMKLSVEVNTGSGFQALVDDVPFGSIPYAKVAKNFYGQTDKEIKLTTTTGSLYHGLRLAKGNDDWYLYMDSNNSFNISNDGSTVLKVDDTDNSIWIRGELHKTNTGDANLLPMAYGFVQNTGSPTPEISTSNFTVTKVTDGKYKVVLDDLTSSTTLSPYIVVATPEAGFSRYRLTASVDYISTGSEAGKSFYVRIYDTSGSMVDNSFHFIVYKK